MGVKVCGIGVGIVCLIGGLLACGLEWFVVVGWWVGGFGVWVVLAISH